MSRWPVRSAADRFWEKVRIAGPDECWVWTGCINRYGYGYFDAILHYLADAVMETGR